MDAQRFLLDLVELLNAKAAEPEVAARVADLAPRRIAICIYSDDAHLVSQDVAGKRAVRPDPNLTAGQTVYTLLGSFGGGSRLNIAPVDPSEIPTDADGTIFTSVKVVGAIVIGWAPGPNGAPVPFDALTAQRDGWLSFVGTSPADAIAVIDSFRGLIDAARARMTATAPPFAGGVAPGLAAERDRSRSVGPSRSELERDLRLLGATDEEVRAAFADEVAETPKPPATHSRAKATIPIFGGGS